MYRAPVADIAFTLKNSAGFAAARAEGIYQDLGDDLLEAVLEEAGKFASDVIAPLNRIGDQQGALFKDGGVTMPPGWKDAYTAWAAAGWNGLAGPTEWGGQGLPWAINAACVEMWNSASAAFAVGPTLTMAGIDALSAHGSAKTSSCLRASRSCQRDNQEPTTGIRRLREKSRAGAHCSRISRLAEWTRSSSAVSPPTIA